MKFSTKRSIILGWMNFVVLTDLVLYAIMITNTNSILYELAHKYTWQVDPTWIMTTMATILALTVIMWRLTIEKDRLSEEAYQIISLIVVAWVFELIVYEKVLGFEHYTKYLDAVRWFSFWMCATWLRRLQMQTGN